MIKQYRSTGAYQADQAAMTARGYRVASVASQQPRSGCLRIVLLGGIGALVWKPKPILIVTYEVAPAA